MEFFMSLIKAYAVGGAICVFAQILLDRTKLTPARILVAYVIAGVFLGAVGLYAPIVDFAGAGASVPLSGFGHLMAQGVRDAIDEQGAIGILTGAFSAASAGIGAAILFSLLAGIVSKPKEK